MQALNALVVLEKASRTPSAPPEEDRSFGGSLSIKQVMDRAVDAPDVGTPLPAASSSIFYGTESEWWDQVLASMRQRHAQQLRPLRELGGGKKNNNNNNDNNNNDDDDNDNDNGSGDDVVDTDDFVDDVDTSEDDKGSEKTQEYSNEGENTDGGVEKDDDSGGGDASCQSPTDYRSDSCDSSAEESGHAGDNSCDGGGSDDDTNEEAETSNVDSDGDTQRDGHNVSEDGRDNGSSSIPDIPVPAWRRRIPRRQRAGSGAADGFPFPSQRTDGKGSDGRSPRPPKVRGPPSQPKSGQRPGRRTHSTSGAGPDSPSQRPRRFKWQKVLTHEQGLEGSVWSPAAGSFMSSDSSGSSGHRRTTTTGSGSERKFLHSPRKRQRGESAVEDVLILVGGVNGGVEGPAGLYHHLHSLARVGSKPSSRDSNSNDHDQETGAAEEPVNRTFSGSNNDSAAPLAGWSILSLNTRHCLDDAIPVRTIWIWHPGDRIAG